MGGPAAESPEPRALSGIAGRGGGRQVPCPLPAPARPPFPFFLFIL